MILGADEITSKILNGVPARFFMGEDGRLEQQLDKHPNYVRVYAGLAHYALIENFPPDFRIEGVEADLSLDELYIPYPGDRYLYTDSRDTGNYKVVDPREDPVIHKLVYRLEPNKYYLAKTREEINMPLDLSGLLTPRTTMFRSGIQVLCTKVSPNYFGLLTVGLKVLGESDVVIEKGFRIVSIEFRKVIGRSEAYKGLWQGGKLTTVGAEAPR